MQKERDRLKRDLGRAQALLRVVRKSVRLTGLSKPVKKHRRRSSRPKKLIGRLREPEAVNPPTQEPDEGR